MAPSGDIRMGGLVTQILTLNNIPIPPVDALAGSKLLDKTFCVSTHLLGVYRPNRRLRAFQFTFVRHGEVQQELLPFAQAFAIAGRNDWVLTPEEFHQAHILVGREQGEDNPDWEGAVGADDEAPDNWGWGGAGARGAPSFSWHDAQF